MARYSIEDTTLTDIANAIRTKKGKTDSIQVADMADEINGIESGSGGTGMKTCTVRMMIDEGFAVCYTCMENNEIMSKIILDPIADDVKCLVGSNIIVFNNSGMLMSYSFDNLEQSNESAFLHADTVIFYVNDTTTASLSVFED